MDKRRIINLLEEFSPHRKPLMHRRRTLRATFSSASFYITIRVTLAEKVGLSVAEDPICSCFFCVKLHRLKKVRILSNLAREEAFRRLPTFLLLPYFLLKEHLLLVFDTLKFFLTQFIVRILEPFDETIFRVLRR